MMDNRRGSLHPQDHPLPIIHDQSLRLLRARFGPLRRYCRRRPGPERSVCEMGCARARGGVDKRRIQGRRWHRQDAGTHLWHHLRRQTDDAA